MGPFWSDIPLKLWAKTKISSRRDTHKADCFYTAVNFLCLTQLGGGQPAYSPAARFANRAVWLDDVTVRTSAVERQPPHRTRSESGFIEVRNPIRTGFRVNKVNPGIGEAKKLILCRSERDYPD